MLTTQDIRIVKSTVPLLEAGGSAITDHFYKRMFAKNPELKNIFNMSNQHSGRQKVALFEAILAYAKNIDNLVDMFGQIFIIFSQILSNFGHIYTNLINPVNLFLSNSARFVKFDKFPPKPAQ